MCTYICSRNLTVPAAASASHFAPAAATRHHPRGRALYDFVASGPTELSLKAGETVELHDTSDTDWWYGAAKAGEGYFPSSYVEKE